MATTLEIAIERVKSRNLAKIVQEFKGFIIMAQSEHDLEAKKNKISRGDTFGFYTIETALQIKPLGL